MKFGLLLSTLLLATFVYTQAQTDLRFDYNWGTNVPGLSPLQVNISTSDNNYLVFTFVDNATHSIVSTNTIQGAYDPSQLIPGSNVNEYPFASGPFQGAGNFFAIVFYAESSSTPAGVYYIRDEYDSNLSGIINLYNAEPSVVPTPSAVAASVSPSSVVASASAAASSIVASVAASVAASASRAAISPSGVAASASVAAVSPSAAAASASRAAVSASAVAASASASGVAASASRVAASPSSSRAAVNSGSATATTSATATPSPSPCTKDTDGDGVPDCFDLCPRNKQKTAPSGPYGCGNKPKSSHTVIEFDFDILSPMNCTDMFD